VPDRIAADLGANLHFARLTGHGRDGPAMAEATAGAWLADTAEAIAIGRRIGGRVLLVGCSTGATLAALAAADPDLSEGLAGVVLVSPNFAPANPAARLLTWPLARRWVPWLTGPDRGFEPYNAEHAAHWTTRYPVAALFPMAEIVAAARRADLGVAEVPALFVYSVHDEVVSPGAIKRAATRWGGPVRQELLVPGPEDDPDAHVLGGDILSPGLTEPLVQIVAGWAAEL
jgi:alpha-beta hydrolase superfamily lysophospholipase